MNAMTEIAHLEPRQLRNVLGRFFTGVTVVTTVDETGTAWGVTANSFTSVSLDPPLILWNQALSSRSHAIYREAERFAINILAHDQVAVSQQFSRSTPIRFDDLPVTAGLGNVPLISGCCAVLECRRFATYPGGDHAIFLGEVERISGSDLPPLLFGDGRYQSVAVA